jgi:beta-hydroxylase
MKWPGAGSALALHQDWTYVDERVHRSFAVWVALDDCNPDLDNGPLLAVPASHHLVDAFRGPATPDWFAPHAEQVYDRLVPIAARSGEAIIMDNRVLHASPDNRSGRPRLALAAAVVPRSAQLVHAVALDHDTVRVIEVSDDFFAEQSPRTLAAAPVDSWADYPTLGETERMQAINQRALLEEIAGGAWPLTRQPSLGASEPASVGTDPLALLLGFVFRMGHRRMASDSLLGPGPVFGPEQLPFLAELERSAEVIAAEYDAIAGEGLRPVPMEMLTGCEMYNRGRWDAFLLKDNREWFAPSLRRFPRTIEALRRVPGLQSACFSVLEPGASISPHRGPNNGVLRVHLGIHVPGPAGACTLDVGDRRVAWAEGVAFAFDDTYEHAARNRAEAPRVSLMLEVTRPATGWAAKRIQLVQRLFLLHPQLRHAAARSAEADAVVNGGAHRQTKEPV